MYTEDLYFHFFFQTRNVCFRIYIPRDIKKILKVTMHFEKIKDLDCSELKNIPGYNLWEACLKIPCSLHMIEYQYCMDVDSSIHVDFSFLGSLKIIDKTKELKTKKFYAKAATSLICQLAFTASQEEVIKGYFEHCFYILKSATSGREYECMLQVKEMENLSSHTTFEERNSVLQTLIQKMTEYGLTQTTNCLVLVGFLSQQNVTFSTLKNIIPSPFAATIFHRCITISNESIPMSPDDFFRMMEIIYACTENANVLSFCYHMWPFSNAKLWSNMFSKRRSAPANFLPLHPNEEQSKELIKSLVNRVFMGNKSHNFSAESTSFFESLQRLMPFDLQLELFKQLRSVDIETIDKFYEILLSLCQRKMSEVSRQGELICILGYWKKVGSVLSPDTIDEWTEKCLIGSFDKANEKQLKESCFMLQKLIVSDRLFLETASQVQLIKKISSSPDENMHNLVPVFLKEEKFQNISSNDLTEIVLSWFHYATNHFCGNIFKRRTLSNSLVKLYSFVGEILSNEWLCLHLELLEELKKKTYEYLHGVEVSAILDAMPKMEQFADGPVKDLFKDHLETLLTLGLGNGDINRSELFGRLQTIEVNSK